MTPPRQKTLLTKMVGRLRLGLYAHHDYLAVSGPLETLEDLEHHATIGFDQDDAALRSIHSELVALPSFTLRTDNQIAQVAAVRVGFGIGVVQDAIACRDPALKAVLQDVFAAYLDVWIVMHEDLKTTRRMRIAFDALVDGLSAHVRAGQANAG